MTEPASRHGRAAFAFIFVTVLLDMLAIGIIVPVLPKLIVQFEHGNISMAATQNGIFAFVFAAFLTLAFALLDEYCNAGLLRTLLKVVVFFTLRLALVWLDVTRSLNNARRLRLSSPPRLRRECPSGLLK